MKNAKWKAFTYQFTNVILFVAIVFTVAGLCKDFLRPKVWDDPMFIIYYTIAIVILSFALLYNVASINQFFYTKMEPLYTRTLYEHIIHVSKGYYMTYIHCLLHLGMFQQSADLLKTLKTRGAEKFFKAYFEGLLAYQNKDIQALEEAIKNIEVPVKHNHPNQPSFRLILLGKQALLKEEYHVALMHFEDAYRKSILEVDKLSIQYDLGLTSLGLQEKEDAKRYFEKVKKGNPDLYFVKQAKKQVVN